MACNGLLALDWDGIVRGILFLMLLLLLMKCAF